MEEADTISKSHIRSFISKREKLMLLFLVVYGRLRKFKVAKSGLKISISSGKNKIILRSENLVYAKDVIDEFSSYFEAVISQPGESQFLVADFSATLSHALVGFDLFPVLIPGLPEPMETVDQYIDLAQIGINDVVLDLGAYAGISGLAFAEVVGPQGKVISVEADPRNFECARENIEKYRMMRGFAPQLINAAIFSSEGSVKFSSEGGLGSAVAAVQTRSMSSIIDVPSMTLSGLMERFELTHVNVIKADIEGAEFAAFSDSKFFKKHHPRIVFEPAMNHLSETKSSSIIDLLSSYGYVCTVHNQTGSKLPLILAR